LRFVEHGETVRQLARRRAIGRSGLGGLSFIGFLSESRHSVGDRGPGAGITTTGVRAGQRGPIICWFVEGSEPVANRAASAARWKRGLRWARIGLLERLHSICKL
jgi:hypothetical protein